MRFPRIRIRILLFLALLVGAGLALMSNRFVFLLPEEHLHKARLGVRDRLQARGLVSSLSFNEPFLRDHARNQEVEFSHVKAVPGVEGGARRFHGDEDAIVSTGARWNELGDSYSCLLRIRFRKGSPKTQEICHSAARLSPQGFSLEDGRIRFSFWAKGGGASLEAPIRHRARWHSFLVVADAEANSVRLYDNGRLVAATNAQPVASDGIPISFGDPQWRPLYADIDEADFWRRPLTQREISAVSRPTFNAVRKFAPIHGFMARAAESAGYLLPASVRAMERLSASASFQADQTALPTLDIHLSQSDLRHFAAAHESSLQSGGRTDKGANFRACAFSTRNGRVQGRLCLDNPYIYHNRARRPAYVAIVDLDGDGEEERLHLYPPEDFTLLHPGYGPPLSMFTASYIRLSLNGAAKGIYCIDLFQQNGEAWVLDMAFFNPASPLRQNPRRVFDIYDLLSQEGRNQRQDEILHLILSDPSSSWSRRQWMDAREEQLYTVAKRGLPHPFPTAQNALGANMAPFLVTTNLDLADPTLSIVHRWESSRPDVVTEDGVVHRPAGDVPVRVTLTGYDLDEMPYVALELRVMPERPRLPVLLLYLSIPPTKHRRSDFTALYIPPGGGSPRRLSGFGGTGAGVKPRGNTSFVKGAKKPLSLKFDGPHGIFGPEEDRGLYLLGGYSDMTRLRSRLCLNSFRSFAPPDTPCVAPDVSWVEVFINNDYYGVFEMCSRVKAPLFKDLSSPPELFKAKALTPLFGEVSARAFTQEYPKIEKTCRIDSVLELMEALTDPDAGRFRQAIDRKMYLANLIDYHLLVNFTGNEDGRVTNFILAHETSHDERYYLIPWDYDKTFRREIRPSFLTNRLFERLYKDYPGFSRSVRNRWKELRAGPLAETNLFARIDEDAAFLAPYMPFEYEILGRKDLQYGEQVQILRDMVRRNLDFVDHWAEARGSTKDNTPGRTSPVVE